MHALRLLCDKVQEHCVEALTKRDEIPEPGSPHDIQCGDKVVVIKVRGQMGDEKILTQKLTKFQMIPQDHQSNAGDARGASTARLTEEKTTSAIVNPVAQSPSVPNAASPQSSRTQHQRRGSLTRKSTAATIEEDVSSAVWIGGIPASMDTAQIAEKFKTYGHVQNATLRQKKFSNGSWAFLKDYRQE